MNLVGSAYVALGTMSAGLLRRMLARRVLRGKEIAGRLEERFGVASLARPEGQLVWFHAASVGETLSVLPVIEALAGRAAVLLTTGTVTSAALAAERLPEGAVHQFNPLDVPAWVARFLAHWRPDCAVFVEGELWPTTLRLLDAAGVPRLLVNASMSARSAGRWRWVRGFAGELIGGFRRVHVQSAQDAENFARLGAKHILQWGNLKFAAPLLPVDEAALAVMRAAMPNRVWVAASTHPGEEEMVIAAHRQLVEDFPELLTVIVPRHPERGAEVAALAGDVAVARRSLGEAPLASGVYVADTLGELGLFYRLAPLAFVGGSLVGIGGHNITEPARLGVGVIVGPHTRDIVELVEKLKSCDAVVEVADAAGLRAAVQGWLTDPEAAQRAGERARQAFAGLEDLPGRLGDLILDMSL
jgi:3-deoxy-D-manno-octulosonic-acid transferase